ncbi:oligosaccharide flippase family protein [Dyadobacter chenwenxiniae]|uniref:Oligosaccharide flippase family protein n=1 Tax=Dyadobacter chenwenxiniae TaxID=2906456 RepID=A0A9X1PKU6_9BACT|nr:polysaccharide biosynthesis C-terminal domain-containing protein [Dyadobacter chenwenxiniae]MCF0062059.1 oligosaccharide flippase family protein [Dyadobacter chenwenxiniae]UON81866.1 oligosaccharide flippase family protein [Dyadobacter chenwenxiniae]
MSVLKKLASETAIYGISTMLGRFLNYLLVALHTKLFEPEQIAAQGQLYAYAGLGMVLYTFGMETAFFRFARQETDRKAYYNLILSAVIIISVFFSGLLFIFAGPAAEFIKYPESVALVRMFAVIMAIDGIVSIPFARLRLEGKGKKFVVVRVANIAVNIFLNLFFLIVCRDIHAGKYLAFLQPAIDAIYDPLRAPDYIVMANLVANILFFFMLRKEFADFKFVFNKTLFRPVWIYAYPIMIMNAGGVLNMLFDRAFIQFLLPENFYPGRTSKQAIGIYIQCYKLSIFMNLAIQSFKYAAEPFFFSKGEDKNAPPVFAKVTKYFIIICVLMWVGICLNLDLLAALFLKQKIYHEGLPVVPWLLAGYLFLGVYYNLATWFKLTDKTEYGTWLTLMGAAITIATSFMLVPQIGYLGFAIAFAASSFIMVALCYYFGQKYYPVPYDVLSAVGYIGIGGLVITASTFVKIPNLYIAVPVHMLVLALFAFVVFLIERKNIPFLNRR